ncbi:MAG TPA: hypothetical protein PLF92_08905 [Arenimonas sp.]|jgi:hypothetical protein|nr:hypothetical protein [Arenimonas sp.]HOZ05483.1 hypothetical protein [Arenimonas sp.]HPW33015.1 hypothetical protein [Arenimonas sp.]
MTEALAFLQEMAAIWWVWLIVAFVMAGSAAFSGMFALASGTAFGTHYHTLTSRQRWMSRLALYSAILTCFFTTIVGFAAAIYCVVILLR